jgi:hypothetical protein
MGSGKPGRFKTLLISLTTKEGWNIQEFHIICTRLLLNRFFHLNRLLCLLSLTISDHRW